MAKREASKDRVFLPRFNAKTKCQLEKIGILHPRGLSAIDPEDRKPDPISHLLIDS
jgi:hypothetical protein